MAGPRATQKRQRALAAAGGQHVQPSHQLGDRVVPRHRLVLRVAAIAGSLQRLRDAVRVVGHLNRCLPSRAQPAVIHRVLGGALQLLRRVDAHEAGLPVAHHVAVRVHHAHGQAAARRAHRTDARLPGRLARNDVLVGHEPDQRVLGTAAARQRGGGAADGSELDEGAAIHQKWQVRQSSGACLSWWQFTQKPMFRSTVFCATVCWPIGPWQVSHAISFADVRRVVELHVRRRRIAVDALPGEIDALLAHRGDQLDARPVGGDGVVADHAGAHARQPRHRPGGHAFVAVLGAGDLLADVDVVRELDRLHRAPAAAPGSRRARRGGWGARWSTPRATPRAGRDRPAAAEAWWCRCSRSRPQSAIPRRTPKERPRTSREA